MIPDDYNYMRALWDRFYERTAADTVSDELHHTLSEQLDTDGRKQLLRLIDCKNMYTEIVSLESFIAGFRLAVGIASELSGAWFDYNKEEDTKIGRYLHSSNN